MSIWKYFVLAIALCLSSACAAAPTPTPTSVPLPTRAPSPTITPTPIVLRLRTVPLPKPVGDRYAPPDVPACEDAQLLNEPIKFGWEKTMYEFSNVPENQWTFYRCAQSRRAATAFYRQWMATSHYNWLEKDLVERPEATLLVYNNSPVSMTHGYRWVYLWFLPEKSNDQISYLAAAWWDAPHLC